MAGSIKPRDLVRLRYLGPVWWLRTWPPVEEADIATEIVDYLAPIDQNTF